VGGDSEGADSSELIVGELLANTVEHAPGPVEVAIAWIASQPVLIVRDTGPGLDTFSATLPEDMMDEGGRGLFLVHALASKVTVVASPTGGAELHVVLPMTRRSEPEPCRNSGT
jgi:anti-sigma regulatory factor (Ser/Thr protein kinase)